MTAPLDDDARGRPRRGRFETTHWSVVLAAAGQPGDEGARALATLCERYWYPLYAHLRRQGHSSDDAQDLTQAFFARLLEKRWLEDVRPERGRFRSFLLASITHFVSNERDRARALKRGGPTPPVSLDVAWAEDRFQYEPRDESTPERLFDREWALTLLERVLERLGSEYAARKRGDLFAALKGYLTGEDENTAYRPVAESLGMSEGAVKVAVHRMRGRFRALLVDEIAQTVAEPSQIDDEIHHLLRAVER